MQRAQLVGSSEFLGTSPMHLFFLPGAGQPASVCASALTYERPPPIGREACVFSFYPLADSASQAFVGSAFKRHPIGTRGLAVQRLHRTPGRRLGRRGLIQIEVDIVIEDARAFVVRRRVRETNLDDLVHQRLIDHDRQ